MIAEVYFLIEVNAAEKVDLLKTDWSFKGLFGKFDRGSLQEYILSNFVPDGRNTFNSSRWQYQSKENQVIIFPSWISHSVGVNESDSDRISIALNVKI